MHHPSNEPPVDATPSVTASPDATPEELAPKHEAPVVPVAAVVATPSASPTTTGAKQSGTFAKLEAVKNAVEIVAILASGYWAYTHYFRGEAPSLEARAHLSVSVTSSGAKEGHCMAKMRTRVKNIGKTSFDVTSVQLDVWLPVYNPASSKSITRFDVEAIMKTPPALTETLNEGSLTGHYPPDVEQMDDYHFAVPIGDAVYPTEALALFRFSGLAVDAENKPVPLTDWFWTDRCDSEAGQPQVPQATPASSMEGNAVQAPQAELHPK